MLGEWMILAHGANLVFTDWRIQLTTPVFNTTAGVVDD
jgi:hypothetical protein